ncbi:MAG: hypothetical protein LBK72_09260 [Bifidobacteriaceae bacterium]|nr:hypothetical protein [Bifidobacteriaceae bacterium]
MSLTPDGLQPDRDSIALERELLDLLEPLGARRRDLGLEPHDEARLRAKAMADMEQVLRTEPRPAPELVWSIRRWWLILRTLGIGGRWWLLAAVPVAATVLLVVAIVVGSVLSDVPTPAVAVTPPMPVFSGVAGGSVPLRGEDAGPMLRHLAARAAAGPDQPVGEAQLVDIAEWWVQTNPDTGKAEAGGGLVPSRVQLFTLADGVMRLIQRRGEPLNPDEGLVDTETTWLTISDETFPGAEDQSPLYAQTLPTESETLVSQLFPDLRECPSLSQCLASEIRHLHGTYVVPASVRAALWEALADTEGVWYLGETHDRLGRSGVAFAADLGTDRQIVLYANQDTGAYLGAEIILTKHSDQLDIDAPAVIEFAALLDARWLDTDQIPPQ